MISPSSSLHCSPAATAMAIMHSQSQLLSPPQEGKSDGSNSNVNVSSSDSDVNGSYSNGIAMNVILNEEEQGQMRIAFELIEEARDMENYSHATHTHSHSHSHSHTGMVDAVVGEDNNDHDNDCDCDFDYDEHQQYHFHIQSENKQYRLYKKALSIMESVVGFYHPNVSNTYHLFGWCIYELGSGGDSSGDSSGSGSGSGSNNNKRTTAQAIIYLLRALKINQRLYGNEHTSTCIVLDDIRDLVHEHQRVEYNNNTVLEHHCNNIFDSWVYQNLAEEALLIHNDPITSIRFYNEALCLLPTVSSMTKTKTKTKVSRSAMNTTSVMNTSTATSMTKSTTTTNKSKGTTTLNDDDDDDDDEEEMLDDNDNDGNDEDSNDSSSSSIDIDNNGDDAVTTIGNDDDDDDHGNESNNDNNCDNNDEDNVCIAELERGIIQLNMAVIIQQYQMHFVLPSPITSVNNANNNDNNHNCSDNDNSDNNSDDRYNNCVAFDFYCKSLTVLSYWLSDKHPTVLQAKSINPCHLMYALGYY